MRVYRLGHRAPGPSSRPFEKELIVSPFYHPVPLCGSSGAVNGRFMVSQEVQLVCMGKTRG